MCRNVHKCLWATGGCRPGYILQQLSCVSLVLVLVRPRARLLLQGPVSRPAGIKTHNSRELRRLMVAQYQRGRSRGRGLQAGTFKTCFASLFFIVCLLMPHLCFFCKCKNKKFQ